MFCTLSVVCRHAAFVTFVLSETAAAHLSSPMEEIVCEINYNSVGDQCSMTPQTYLQ